jgi:signal transduction histidine kinase
MGIAQGGLIAEPVAEEARRATAAAAPTAGLLEWHSYALAGAVVALVVGFVSQRHARMGNDFSRSVARIVAVIAPALLLVKGSAVQHTSPRIALLLVHSLALATAGLGNHPLVFGLAVHPAGDVLLWRLGGHRCLVSAASCALIAVSLALNDTSPAGMARDSTYLEETLLALGVAFCVSMQLRHAAQVLGAIATERQRRLRHALFASFVHEARNAIFCLRTMSSTDSTGGRLSSQTQKKLYENARRAMQRAGEVALPLVNEPESPQSALHSFSSPTERLLLPVPRAIVGQPELPWSNLLFMSAIWGRTIGIAHSTQPRSVRFLKEPWNAQEIFLQLNENTLAILMALFEGYLGAFVALKHAREAEYQDVKVHVFLEGPWDTLDEESPALHGDDTKHSCPWQFTWTMDLDGDLTPDEHRVLFGSGIESAIPDEVGSVLSRLKLWLLRARLCKQLRDMAQLQAVDAGCDRLPSNEGPGKSRLWLRVAVLAAARTEAPTAGEEGRGALGKTGDEDGRRVGTGNEGAAVAHGRALHVLFVDDNPAMALAVGIPKHHRVQVASSGPDALKLLQSVSFPDDAFDIALVDRHLGEMSGEATIAEIAKLCVQGTSGVPVPVTVLVSGGGDAAYAGVVEKGDAAAQIAHIYQRLSQQRASAPDVASESVGRGKAPPWHNHPAFPLVRAREASHAVSELRDGGKLRSSDATSQDEVFCVCASDALPGVAYVLFLVAILFLFGVSPIYCAALAVASFSIDPVYFAGVLVAASPRIVAFVVALLTLLTLFFSSWDPLASLLAALVVVASLSRALSVGIDCRSDGTRRDLSPVSRPDASVLAALDLLREAVVDEIHVQATTLLTLSQSLQRAETRTDVERNYALLQRLAAEAKCAFSDALPTEAAAGGAVEFNIAGDILDFCSQMASFALSAHRTRGLVRTLVDPAEATLPGHCVGDVLRLRQVLSNLIFNAVRFTSEGAIRIAARRFEGQFAVIDGQQVPLPLSQTVQSNHAAASDESAERTVWLEVVVQDSGEGIPPEKLAHIFGEMEGQRDLQLDSTSRLPGGSGRGLQLCAQLVAAMGGNVACASQPRVGSVFSVVVPCRLRDVACAEQGEHASLQPPPVLS